MNILNFSKMCMMLTIHRNALIIDLKRRHLLIWIEVTHYACELMNWDKYVCEWIKGELSVIKQAV